MVDTPAGQCKPATLLSAIMADACPALSVDNTKAYSLLSATFADLPRDVILHHIIPCVARDWLFVSHYWHTISFRNLLQDDRIHLTRDDLTSLLLDVAAKGYTKVFCLLLTDSRLYPTTWFVTALRIASMNNQLEIMSTLLKMDPHLVPREINSEILYYAIFHDQSAIVALLLSDRRVQQLLPDDDAIMIAAEYDNTDTMAVLLKDGRFNPALNDNRALTLAVEDGVYENVALLLADPRVNPTPQQKSLLISAARGGNNKMVQLLLSDARVNPVDNGNPAVRAALLHGHQDVALTLLSDRRIDPRGWCKTIFAYAPRVCVRPCPPGLTLYFKFIPALIFRHCMLALCRLLL